MTVGCPVKNYMCPRRHLLAIANFSDQDTSHEVHETDARCILQETEKARRYIEQLNSARSQDRWHEVPALVRKLEKHTPHRKSLIKTAKSEEKVISHVGSRPVRPSDNAKDSQIAQELSILPAAAEHDSSNGFDTFEAIICLGWIHWILGQPDSAIERLPANIIREIVSINGNTHSLDEWACVAVVKGTYIKGICQEDLYDSASAELTYKSLLPFIKENLKHVSSSPQFRKWSYALLSRHCILASAGTCHYDSGRRYNALEAFRAWTGFRDASKGSLESHDSRGDREIWRSYFKILSNILHTGSFSALSEDELACIGHKSAEKPTFDVKNQFRAKLQQIESAYEGLMLTETRFPQAREKNVEAEWWADMATANWRVLHIYDLQTGSSGTSRILSECQRILEILFRAAAKTFHSTRILRHMFTVYVALFDFEMAFKAFDVYVELSTAGRSRNRRSNESESIEVDDDELYIRTLADAIGVLCRFGRREDAEKAREIEKLIEDWLGLHAQPHEETAYGPLSDPLPKSQERGDTAMNVSAAYRALGISRAHWARLTYDGDRRTLLQTDALANFKKALENQPSGPLDVDTLYAMALVAADMRNISEAVKTLKIALASPAEPLTSSISSANESKTDVFGEVLHGGAVFNRERKLVPLWHLLALLLTARGDLSPAAKSCEAVFKQFGDQSNLFSDERSIESRQHVRKHGSVTSEEKECQPPAIGVIGVMNSFEKEELLQVKITQLALVETVEGPVAAVDGTDELFALYARLFGEPKIEGVRKLAQTVPDLRPGTAASGVRSIAGSIFGRSRLSHRGRDRPQSLPVQASRPSTARTAPQTRKPGAQVTPIIQVTNENGTAEEKVSEPLHRGSQDATPRHRHSSILKRRSGGSLRKRSGSAPGSRPEEALSVKGYKSNGTDANHDEDTVPPLPDTGRRSKNESYARAENGENLSRPTTSQSLRGAATNMDNEGHPDRVLKHPNGGLAGPSPYAINLLHNPVFSTLQDSRQKCSLLIRLWLYVSGLYIRAGMLDDAKAAMDEAQKILERFEVEVAQTRSSSKAFAERGWGAGGSVNELWADVWTERGILAQEQREPHLALEQFEQALSYFSDHPQATVGASDILLDIYTRRIPLEPGMESDDQSCSSRSISPERSNNAVYANGDTEHVTSNGTGTSPLSPRARATVPRIFSPTAPNPSSIITTASTTLRSSANLNINNAEHLSRLATRDRAYGLLSSLSNLGSGWDYSEAWVTLARAYEESGQIDKAKEALWWCVDLEDSRPVRPWSCLGPGGFVL